MDFMLQSLQGKIINQAGRSTKIQDVVGTMAIFQMGCLKMPDKSIKKLKSLRRNYWWNTNNSKGCRFIGRIDLCKSQIFGGLGFKSLKYFNEAFLTKLAWRMIHEKHAKWVQLLEAKYVWNVDPIFGKVIKNGTWIWQGSFLEAMAFTIGARDIHQAEALVVLYALNWIASKNFSQIIIEGDNKSIMEALSSGNLEGVKWKDKFLLMECASVFGKLKDVQVMFIHRRENKVADTLAKYSRTHHSNSYWLSKPPSIIYELLLQDQKDMHLDN